MSNPSLAWKKTDIFKISGDDDDVNRAVTYNICVIMSFPQHRFIYETEQFNGTGELLEILGR